MRKVWWSVAWKLQKCCKGVGSDADMKPNYTFFWKKDLECSFRLFFSCVHEFTLATNNRLGYDMKRVKLKMTCTALFCIQLLSWML